MSGKGKRPLLSAVEKVEAIRRVHEGESKASVARDIGVPESTLRGWCKNEDKIVYLSRQSTPETASLTTPNPDGEPDSKRTRLDYSTALSGLTLATSVSSTDNRVTGFDPQYNLLTTVPTHSDKSKRSSNERARTRAELDRLSVELGLKQPEYGLNQEQAINSSMLATSPLTNLNHMSGGTSHTTANLGTSFQEIAAKVWNQVNNQAVVAAAAQMAQNSLLTNKSYSASSSSKRYSDPTTIGLNLAKDTSKKTSSSSSQPLTDESTVWLWLRAQQEMLALAQNAQKHLTPQQTAGNLTSTSSSLTNLSDPKQNALLWKLYKQFNYGLQSSLPTTSQQNTMGMDLSATAAVPTTSTTTSTTTFNNWPMDNNILLQQLTKSNSQTPGNPSRENAVASPKRERKVDTTPTSTPPPPLSSKSPTPPRESEPISRSKQSDDEDPINCTVNKSPTKVRAVLDNLLSNNNNVINSDENNQDVKENNIDSAPATLADAIEYGQKFLKWLEECSDPGVTAMQVMQVRYLLNNLKSSANRRVNGTAANSNERTHRRK